MALRVLFWNVKGRVDALELVPALVRELEPHILTLLEAPRSTADRLRAAGLAAESPVGEIPSADANPRDLRTFTLDTSLRLRARTHDRYHRAYELASPGFQSLTFVAVHLESSLHDKADHDLPRARANDCHTFVEKVERVAGHARTVVYGDFNMDPFAHAMVNFYGLNAMSTAFRARAARGYRGKTRAMFYNPMWSLLGDRRSRPDERVSSPGTFYMDEKGPAGYFWHMPTRSWFGPSSARTSGSYASSTKSSRRRW